MPAAIVARINADTNATLATSVLKARLAARGVEARGGKPEEFAAFLRSEIPKWTKVVRNCGASAN